MTCDSDGLSSNYCGNERRKTAYIHTYIHTYIENLIYVFLFVSLHNAI